MQTTRADGSKRSYPRERSKTQRPRRPGGSKGLLRGWLLGYNTRRGMRTGRVQSGSECARSAARIATAELAKGRRRGEREQKPLGSVRQSKGGRVRVVQQCNGRRMDGLQTTKAMNERAHRAPGRASAGARSRGRVCRLAGMVVRRLGHYGPEPRAQAAGRCRSSEPTCIPEEVRIVRTARSQWTGLRVSKGHRCVPRSVGWSAAQQRNPPGAR